MFGKNKKSLNVIHIVIKQLGDRIAVLETEKSELRKEVDMLKQKVAEQSKKTLSQMTNQPEKQVPFSQVVDEWINGSEGEDNGN
ncbi:MAG TPA: hypothetical protein PKV66_00385 [Candidatus Pelethenecus sp.]|nr:hypothetical protein [Candidatus Pelethenecus sp.]